MFFEGKRRKDEPVRITDANTEYGPVQGFIVELYDNPLPNSAYKPQNNQQEEVQGTVKVFLGIPYAAPPIGDRRFKPPVPSKSWAVYQAMDYGARCPQPYDGNLRKSNTTYKVSEDCLFLNIYAPNNQQVNKKYPVMIYIHGGHYTRGASNSFPGHVMAAFYDVIVVTINYRLGALGFLSTNDRHLPGNYGILDQIFAIKWIYNNIKHFNGDEQSLTLFGPDAGAASATILMLAPQTRHLITKVIAQSGSVLADWAYFHDFYRIQNISRSFGQSLGCGFERSLQLSKCLKESRNFHDIGNVQLSNDFVGMFPWAPVLNPKRKKSIFYTNSNPNYEDWFLFDNIPEFLINNKSFHPNLRFMSGITTQEAAYLIRQSDAEQIDQNSFHRKIRELIFRYNYTLNPDGVFEAVKFMYTYWPDVENRSLILENYVRLLSDMLYVAPANKLAELLVQNHVPVYLYVLNTTVEALRKPAWQQYSHDVEYYFLTGAPFMDVEMFPTALRLNRSMWTANDRNMSHFFMKAYTNFAHYGNPSFTQIVGLHFEQANVGDLRYLNINTTFNSSICTNYRSRHAAFWNHYLPTLVRQYLPPFVPFDEFWFERSGDTVQIAFWSVTMLCLFLFFLVVVCCTLWRHEKRKLQLSKDLLMMEPGPEFDNNQYHNLEMFPELKTSLIPQDECMKSSSNDTHDIPSPVHKTTPLLEKKGASKPKTQLILGIPQTDV